MYSIGTIAATLGSSLASLGGQLPWAWFGLMAVADVALVFVVVGRRRAGGLEISAPSARPAGPEVFVLRSGWRVPRSRAIRVRPHPAAYAWPLHSEYMVSRLV